MKTMIAMIIAALTASCGMGKPMDRYCARQGDTFEEVYEKCGPENFERKIISNGYLYEVHFSRGDWFYRNDIENLYVRFNKKGTVEMSIYNGKKGEVYTTQVIQ